MFRVSDESYLRSSIVLSSTNSFVQWSNISDKLASHDSTESSAIFSSSLTEPDYCDDTNKSMSNTRSIGVCTDVCNSSDPDEVEILSLINEQIPKYRLRADTLTEFGGYYNEDWIIQTPLIPLDTEPGLTDEQIGETLKYFILCADRVTQMTRTYNDIEALTRMLEEKERDLELAARIGQTLLEKNKELTERSDGYEEQLSSANDKVSQLRHDLSMKEELLRVYCQDYDNENESDSSSPGEGFNLKLVNVDSLQKKVECLDSENSQLKTEITQLKYETSNYEEKEKNLVEECLKQLSEVNIQVETFAEELERKSDESSRQKEEITKLLGQVVDLQKRVRCLTIENMELSKHLQASQDSQRKLTKELGYRQDKYDELLEVLTDAQDELKCLRGNQRPRAQSRQYLSSSLLSVPPDSLASELESSLREEQEYPKGYSPKERSSHSWKIFETAKAAKKAGKKSPTSNQSTSASGADSDSASSKRASFYMSDGGESADGYSADLDSHHGSNPDLGRPGIPGSNDLETSLKRLAMRRANELNESDYFKDESQKQHTSLSQRTPDSISSPGSGLSFLSVTGSNPNNPYFKLPEKLQIVKPLEGSATLRQWQQLATPNLGGIFEERPGVQIKGERKLDLSEEEYRLSDFEEDDDISECPSKRFEESSTVFTLTDSMVKNPNDYFMLASSPSTSCMTSTTPSNVTSTPITSVPRMRMPALRGGNTSTYSMSLGLAAILNERDHAVSSERKSGLKYNQSYPARLHTVVTETPYKPEVTTTTSSSRRSSVPVTLSPSVESTQAEGGLFGRLKNTGLSLYGFLGGSKDESDSSSDSSSVSMTTATSTVTTPTVSGASAAVEGVAEASPNSEKSLTKTLLTQGASAGVLGALTSFRRSGIL